MKRAKERDSSETAAIKINRRKVCLLIIAIGISVRYPIWKRPVRQIFWPI